MSQKSSPRRRHTAPQKISILRQHLLEGRPVSEVCDEHGINPALFYRWQRELFESGHVVFERRGADPAARKIEKLERKLREKDEVLGEVMADYIAVERMRLGTAEQWAGRASTASELRRKAA